MPKVVEIREFAERVERLCDFLLGKLSSENGRNGTADIVIIEQLKDDAADIHTGNVKVIAETLTGLSDYMKGGSSNENAS